MALSLEAVSSESNAIGHAPTEIGQNLQACLDFALKDFSVPDPERRSECQRIADAALAKLPAEQRARTVKLRVAQTSAAAAGVVALVYLVTVPRRFGAGARGVVLAIVVALVLGGAWLLFALSGMPHLG